MDTGCLSNMSMQFLQSVEWEIFPAFTQFFGEVSLRVTTRRNSLIDQLEASVMCLHEAQIEIARWETSALLWVTLVWSIPVL